MIALTLTCWGFLMESVIGQEAPPPAVYTSAQATKGRSAYQSKTLAAPSDLACADCHRDTLLGRDGTSDIPEFLKTMSGTVPPLAGPKFMEKWGDRTTQDLYNRIQIVLPLDEETTLGIIAYILQVNGARPGTKPLTISSPIEIRSVTLK